MWDGEMEAVGARLSQIKVIQQYSSYLLHWTILVFLYNALTALSQNRRKCFRKVYGNYCPTAYFRDVSELVSGTGKLSKYSQKVYLCTVWFFREYYKSSFYFSKLPIGKYCASQIVLKQMFSYSTGGKLVKERNTVVNCFEIAVRLWLFEPNSCSCVRLSRDTPIYFQEPFSLLVSNRAELWVWRRADFVWNSKVACSFLTWYSYFDLKFPC